MEHDGTARAYLSGPKVYSVFSEAGGAGGCWEQSYSTTGESSKQLAARPELPKDVVQSDPSGA